VNEDLEAAVRRLVDRQEILDCLHRYTRGVDRLDRDMVLSVYHPDAVDDHGHFVGSPEEFVDWLWAKAPGRLATQHYVTNSTIDLDGDTAHVETYFICSMRLDPDHEISFSGGRYVDRFERRDGEWRIAARTVISEWRTRLDGSTFPAGSAAFHPAAQDRTDLSYVRPLVVRREDESRSSGGRSGAASAPQPAARSTSG
jgi:hypothetical protein